MTDRTWFVGAGGYWLANQDDDLKMAYGGMVVDTLRGATNALASAFAGWSAVGAPRSAAPLASTSASTARSRFPAAIPAMTTPSRMVRGGRGRHGGGAFPISADTEILVSEYFFVVEPQASVIWHFTRWARLDLGVGYRLTAGAGSLDEDMRGPSASIAVQFGGSSRKP